MLQIKLEKLKNYVSFRNLEVYKDDVDLELGGHGHYFNKRNMDCSDLKVEKYYKSIDTNYQRSASFQSNAFSPLLCDEGFASSKHIENQQNSVSESNSFPGNLIDEDYVNSNLELSNEELVTFSIIDQEDQDNQESIEHETHNIKYTGWFGDWFSGDGSN